MTIGIVWGTGQERDRARTSRRYRLCEDGQLRLPNLFKEWDEGISSVCVCVSSHA